MPNSPNRLSRFWQELKRRRVIHVITVYATSAFVIIELINNLTDPLNLPSSLPTVVVIVIAVGFPLAIVLSWIYDLTSEGVERIKPLDEIQEGEKRAIPNAWKLATYVSFAVIIGLVTFNIVVGTKGLRSGDIQSLAILPFNNYTGDDELEWVAAGMHSSLIGDMGKVSGLRVLGETTSRAYKEANMTATDIAEKDKVEAIVEPILTCYGDMVCVQVKVVTTYPKEKVLWVEDYVEDKSQILNLYTRMVRKIADELNVNLTLQEETLLTETRIIDPEVYDAYLRGYHYLGDGSLESLNKAKEYLNIAIEKDPEWAPLYASMAQVWMSLQQMNYESPEIAGPKILENLNKALELDPDNAYVHQTNGLAAFVKGWDWEKAEMELLKALAANPNDAMSRIWYAHLLGCLQRTDESLTQGRLAIELDPLNPMVQLLYGVVLMNIGDFKSVLAYGEKITADEPGHVLANT
jgi:TolB-like protein/Tfp pilus assembly protein PilF